MSGGIEDRLVVVRRGKNGGHRCSRRDDRAAEPDVDRRPTQLGAYRRDPAQPLVYGCRKRGRWIGHDLRELVGTREESRKDASGSVTRLLHPAEDGHLERREHELDVAWAPGGLPAGAEQLSHR